MEKRFIAIQIGARRNYLVPSILQQAGMLESFYTDMCANAGLGLMLNRFCPQSLRHNALKQLLNRRVPPSIEGKINTFDGVIIRHSLRRIFLKNNYQVFQNIDRDFGREMSRQGVGNASHIFSMFGEGTDFLEFAKNKGLKIVVEVYISPSTAQIVQKERENFSELEPLKTPPSIIKAERFKRVCRLADMFIVPSYFVKKGLEELGVSTVQCYTVPYGVGEDGIKLDNHPTKGRVLFVGTAGLRKGIHILGMAAQKLSQRSYEFRVAGGVSDILRKHRLTQGLKFLGRVPRTDIQQEYAKADIFVLPTLAEGSAEVTYEALAAGLPVITTEAAGSVIRDGIEGFIIPERDPEALANRIEELVENRELRDRMAIAARERAKDYTWEKYAERLLAVFQMI